MLARAIDVAIPEHLVCDAGMATATGIGLTVITTVLSAPSQPLAEGVIVYVAVPEIIPLVVSDCAIDDPDPAVAPETPD